jgi:hypothetical protein
MENLIHQKLCDYSKYKYKKILHIHHGKIRDRDKIYICKNQTYLKELLPVYLITDDFQQMLYKLTVCINFSN